MVKDRAAQTVDAARERLVALSHAVHGDAEVGFEEHTSSRRVADDLAECGYDVEFGVADLDTAFTATVGTGDLVIGICAEYDALPGIGHACGHNVIAAAAAGAARALAPLVDDLGITVKVFGTPAEEGGGGKILMLERGVMDGVHAAMMVHPAPSESATMPCLAVSHLDITYHGKSAHASAYPHLGRNAADALTVAQVGIGLLRQHLVAGDRIHGIVTRGGDAPNIVPEQTSGEWYVRARDLEALATLYPRVMACFEAGALATGTTVEFTDTSPPYSEFLHDDRLVGNWTRNAEEIGRTFDVDDDGVAGSTDMANVSLHIPSIHPMLAIDADGAVNHQPEFTAACVNASADRAVRDGAVGMAWTAIDAATDDGLRNSLLTHDFVAVRDYRPPTLT